jgi:hypothetical protein
VATYVEIIDELRSYGVPDRAIKTVLIDADRTGRGEVPGLVITRNLATYAIESIDDARWRRDVYPI